MAAAQLDSFEVNRPSHDKAVGDEAVDGVVVGGWGDEVGAAEGEA